MFYSEKALRNPGRTRRCVTGEDHQLTGDLLPLSDGAVNRSNAFGLWKSLLPPRPPSFLLSFKPGGFFPCKQEGISTHKNGNTKRLVGIGRYTTADVLEMLHVHNCSTQSVYFGSQINHSLKGDLWEMTLWRKGSQKRWHNRASGVADITSAGTAA